MLSAAVNACRGVMAWRKWLAEKGSGGPDYEGSMCGEAYRADSGRLDRRALLDRHTQHTANCKACSQVILRCACAHHGVHCCTFALTGMVVPGHCRRHADARTACVQGECH